MQDIDRADRMFLNILQREGRISVMEEVKTDGPLPL